MKGSQETNLARSLRNHGPKEARFPHFFPTLDSGELASETKHSIKSFTLIDVENQLCVQCLRKITTEDFKTALIGIFSILERFTQNYY